MTAVRIEAGPEGATNAYRPLTHPSGISRKGAVVDATHDPEEWRPVVGWNGHYEVSDHGRVRSRDRTIVTKAGVIKRIRGRLMRVHETDGHHHALRLTDDSGANAVVRVHILVLEAFVGQRPEGLVGCHSDGNGFNNRLANLRWDTHGENNFDLVRHGVHVQARKTHCPQGHPYSPENTYIQPGDGGRRCRVCMKARNNRTSRLRSQRRAAARNRVLTADIMASFRR